MGESIYEYTLPIAFFLKQQLYLCLYCVCLDLYFQFDVSMSLELYNIRIINPFCL
jgi:hypothetical protein